MRAYPPFVGHKLLAGLVVYIEYRFTILSRLWVWSVAMMRTAEWTHRALVRCSFIRFSLSLSISLSICNSSGALPKRFNDLLATHQVRDQCHHQRIGAMRRAIEMEQKVEQRPRNL